MGCCDSNGYCMDFTPCNTLGLSTFDVLKMDGVEDPLISVNKLATMDFEESYFTEAVKFIMNQDNEYTKIKNRLYDSISESSTYGIIHEGFSDFISKVKEIIDKFLKFLKSLFNKFITAISKLIDSDKHLKKHKNDFKNFKSADEFDIDGYEYTFSDNVPATSAIADFNASLFTYDDYQIYTSDGTVDITATSVKDFISNYNSEEDYAKFRAKVLGKANDEKIYETNYSDELFKLFRNNEITTSTITIDGVKLRKVVDRFFDFKKNENYVNKKYNEIDKEYKKIQDQVKDIVKRNGNLNIDAFVSKMPSDINNSAGYKIDGKESSTTGIAMSGELMMQLDILVKNRVDMLQEYSNIHLLAFSAKLDAMKECSIQDKNTLYTALSRIQRTDSKRKD